MFIVDRLDLTLKFMSDNMKEYEELKAEINDK
jgi:hypothetical protein